MRQMAIAVGLAVLAAVPARAADMPSDQPSEASALSLADEAPTAKRDSQSWRLFRGGSAGAPMAAQSFGIRRRRPALDRLSLRRRHRAPAEGGAFPTG
jgi:hypothetical protein